MTQAERLIRNLCEERRLQIVEEERKALKAFKGGHTWSELPPAVQHLILEYRRIDRRQTKIIQALKGRGYTAYSHNIHKGKGLDFKDRDERYTAVKTEHDRRREAVKQLRTDATIASLGKTATEAKGILEQLQKDLRRA